MLFFFFFSLQTISVDFLTQTKAGNFLKYLLISIV